MAVVSPDGRRLATGGLAEGTPTLRLWDLATGAPIAAWLDRHVTSLAGGRARHVTSLAWSPDGSRIAVGGHNFPTEQLDASTGAVLARSPVHLYNTDALAYDPASRFLYSSGLDGTGRPHEAASGKRVASHKLRGRQCE